MTSSCVFITSHGSFCVSTQPMRDNVTMYRRLSMAGHIHKMIPVSFLSHVQLWWSPEDRANEFPMMLPWAQISWPRQVSFVIGIYGFRWTASHRIMWTQADLMWPYKMNMSMVTSLTHELTKRFHNIDIIVSADVLVPYVTNASADTMLLWNELQDHDSSEYVAFW